MIKSVYIVTIRGREVMRFRADLSQASSPIEIGGDLGWQSTPFQVADCRHDESEAARLLNRWCHSQGGEAWSEDDDGEIVVEPAEDDASAAD